MRSIRTAPSGVWTSKVRKHIELDRGLAMATKGNSAPFTDDVLENRPDRPHNGGAFQLTLTLISFIYGTLALLMALVGKANPHVYAFGTVYVTVEMLSALVLYWQNELSWDRRLDVRTAGPRRWVRRSVWGTAVVMSGVAAAAMIPGSMAERLLGGTVAMFGRLGCAIAAERYTTRDERLSSLNMRKFIAQRARLPIAMAVFFACAVVPSAVGVAARVQKPRDTQELASPASFSQPVLRSCTLDDAPPALELPPPSVENEPVLPTPRAGGQPDGEDPRDDADDPDDLETGGPSRPTAPSAPPAEPIPGPMPTYTG